MTGESGGRLAGCPSCGTPNPARARFCLRCGVPMDGAGDRVGESAPKGQAPHTPAAAHVRHGGRDETGVALPEERPRAYPRAEQPVADASTQPPPVSPAPPADDAQESPIIEGAETAAAPPSWHGPAASPREAWITLFAFVAGVCFALSLTSIFARPLLIFLAPALALGHWALAQPETRRLPGPRWLALITVAASYLWLLVWIIVLVTARR